MNAENLFTQGDTPELDEVLLNRERRVRFLEELLRRFPGDCVISLKCNIPGPVKNNEEIRSLFGYGYGRIESILMERGWEPDYRKRMDLHTGPEAFWVIAEDSSEVKHQMVLFEEEKLGRIFDADVLDQKEGLARIRSRVELGYQPRRCLICDRDARICASRRLHPVSQLQQKLIQLVRENAAELEPAQSLS